MAVGREPTRSRPRPTTVRSLGLVWCALVLLMVAGCTSTPLGRASECGGGDALVSAANEDGRTWHTTVSRPTEEPPRIMDGYVLVRHACSYSVLDLADGEVVKTGDDGVVTGPDAGAVGIAGGFVYVVTRGLYDTTIDGLPVAGRDVDGVVSSMSGLYEDDRTVTAAVVDESVYVAQEHALALHGPDGEGWTTPLPVLTGARVLHADDLVVATSSDGSVYGLSRDDGRVRWRTTIPAVAITYDLTPRLRGDGVLAVTSRPNQGRATVVEIRVADGRILGVASAAPDPEGVALRAHEDGWTVSIQSDPVAHPGK